MKITLKASMLNIGTVVLTKLDNTLLVKVEEKVEVRVEDGSEKKTNMVLTKWTKKLSSNIWLTFFILGVKIGLIDVKIKYDMSYAFRHDKAVSLIFALESLCLVKKHDKRFWDKGLSENGYTTNKSAMVNYLDSLDENAEYIAQSQTL